MLVDEAEHWWDQQRRGYEAANQEVTWELFRTHFLGKYFPEDVRREKEIAFLRLTQGDLSVGEYAAQFEDLIRYSGSYRDADERTKCIKFEDGLRSDIKLMVEYQNIASLSQLVNMASTVEKGLKRNLAEERGKAVQESSGPDQDEGDAQRVQLYSDRNTRTASTQRIRRRDNTYVPIPPCPHCGRKHLGECWVNSPSLNPSQAQEQYLCFECGQPGHFAARCPNAAVKEEVNTIMARPAKGRRSRQKGKAHTMD